jgi:hypothetical protein
VAGEVVRGWVRFPFDHIHELAGRSLAAFALATDGTTAGDLRQGIGSILAVTERPLTE